MVPCKASHLPLNNNAARVRTHTIDPRGSSTRHYLDDSRPWSIPPGIFRSFVEVARSTKRLLVLLCCNDHRRMVSSFSGASTPLVLPLSLLLLTPFS